MVPDDNVVTYVQGNFMLAMKHDMILNRATVSDTYRSNIAANTYKWTYVAIFTDTNIAENHGVFRDKDIVDSFD